MGCDYYKYDDYDSYGRIAYEMEKAHEARTTDWILHDPALRSKLGKREFTNGAMTMDGNVWHVRWIGGDGNSSSLPTSPPPPPSPFLGIVIVLYLGKSTIFMVSNTSIRIDVDDSTNRDVVRDWICENVQNDKNAVHMLPLEYGAWEDLMRKTFNGKRIDDEMTTMTTKAINKKYSILMSMNGTKDDIDKIREQAKKSLLEQPIYCFLTKPTIHHWPEYKLP